MRKGCGCIGHEENAARNAVLKKKAKKEEGFKETGYRIWLASHQSITISYSLSEQNPTGVPSARFTHDTSSYPTAPEAGRFPC